MKHIVFFLTAALLLNASCGSSDEGGKTDPPAAPVPVAPTTELGKADEAIENLQLKPGKLISINQVNAANCRRAVAAGMCIDIMASDKIVFASDMTDERLDGLFAECGEAIRSTKADFWGLHLPYQTYDISSTNENTRVTAVLKLKRLIELTIEHLRPQHFVIHPGTGTILTTGGDFAERTAQSRKSLAELQRHIESCNAQHGTKAILCVENCARSLAYDGDSLLDLLDAEGLEKVRVCLDTGHALIPLNGKYIDPVRNGDALDVLRRIGTRLGTLHIQQNPGALDPTDPKDKHLEPFSGGLIDWGEFYYELLKNNRYRGCFLYEVSFTDTYDGTTAATVTSVDFDGLVNGEKLDSGTGYTATAVFDDANAGEGKTATVTVELKNTNYTFAGGDTAEHELTGLTIAPCPVTVTPNAKSKAYGQSDPALTYTVSGLASGDSLTGELSRAEGENAGSYAIKQGTLTASSNYTLTFVDNINLTIKKADVTLTVTVDPASQKAGNPVTVTVTAQNAEENLMDTGWDQPDGNVTVTVGGVTIPMTREGDAWTGTYTIPADAQAGDKTVSAGYAGNGNYNDKTNTATLTVNDKGAVTVTLTPSASSVTYGDSVTLTADVAKADPGDQDALTGTVQFYLDHIDEAGKVGDAQDIIDEKPSVTLDRAKLTAGSHTVYAVYEGNNAFATAQAKAGIEVDISQEDVMRIRGGAIRPARVFSHGDHRIAMSMAVSALRSSGTITIEGAEAVAKSYPRFFEDLESLRVN